MTKTIFDFIDFLLIWLPQVVPWLLFLLAASRYFFNNKLSSRWRFLNLKNLIIAALSFRLFYAFLGMAGQYYLWSQGPLSKVFLNSPLSQRVVLPSVLNIFHGLFQSKLGYFLFYSYGRFWLDFLTAFIIALVFYLFLKILKKYQERFFEEGETELGFLMAFIVGLPNFLVFIPLVFILVVLVSLIRLFFFKEAYTTLGTPFLLSALTVLLIGNELVNILKLGGFKP